MSYESRLMAKATEAQWEAARAKDAELQAARDECERACANEALAVYQRDTLAEACRAFLGQLDYLQDLWSKEGVTNTIAEKARHALESLDGDAAK